MKYLKNSKNTLSIIVLLATLGTMLLAGLHASPAYAASTCQDNVTILKAACTKTPIISLLVTFIRFLTIGVGIAVAGGIITGGIIYGTARGNSSQTQKGVIVIVNAVVGLLLYLFMFAILNFLIPGGIIG
jgi:hypothetical protein